MNNSFSFEEQPFEAYSEFDEEETKFDPENFESKLTDSEWGEEIRRGTPFSPRSTRSYRPPGRPPRPMPHRRWPPRRRVWGYSSPPLFVDHRIDGEPPPCICPVHGTEFVRWVQSSLNQVLGLRLPVTGIMNAATRSALRRFQQQHGLAANGIAGPETERALVEAKKPGREKMGGLTDSAEYEELDLPEFGSALVEHQVGPVALPAIPVKDWTRSLNVHFIKVTAAATPDNVTIQGSEKVNPLAFDRPMRMWIHAGELEQNRRGQVGLNLTIEYQGIGKIPRSSKVARERFAISSLILPFECTAEGNIRLIGKPGRRTAPRAGGLSVDIEIYQRRDKPKNKPGGNRAIPSSVWDEWMTKLSILHIVMIVKLTASENGPSWYSVDVKDGSVPIPAAIVAGSTGTHTALLGPMTIDLVPEGARPPITAPQGILKNVYFDVDSSEIDKIVDEGPDGRKHQGNALDAWIRNDVLSRWDVREALLWEELPVRGEARASATLKGKSGAERLRYNQALSEKRLVAVVKRLKKTIIAELGENIRLDTAQMKATGASKARVLGEETVNERRCEIRIDGVDLEKTMKKIYKEPHRWWWER